MFITPNLRSLPSMNIGALKPKGAADVKALRNYVRIRTWQYISYENLMKKVQPGSMAKQFLLDADMQITGRAGKPIAVLYLHDNYVAAYVNLNAQLGKLLPMSMEAVKQLPPSIPT